MHKAGEDSSNSIEQDWDRMDSADLDAVSRPGAITDGPYQRLFVENVIMRERESVCMSDVNPWSFLLQIS